MNRQSSGVLRHVKTAPDQAVLVDLVRERFYFFWIEIWPQEVYYITGLLILASLGLFLVTALLRSTIKLAQRDHRHFKLFC